MLSVHAYGVPSASAPLEAMTIVRRDLRRHDVLIEIKYCGICHSDVNHARSYWQAERYPMVPGHEIAGVVAAVGPEVTRHSPGDRVGVGCMVDSCRTCHSCQHNEEQYCEEGIILTYAGVDRQGEFTQGGYSTHIVVDEDFVLRIPPTLALEVAAPLLCAGITTYWPLRYWGAGPDKRVAVVGLGGLGHMAVKIARAMGAEVSVLSRTGRKRADALRLGAHGYHAVAEQDALRRLANTFDLVVNTVSAPIDVDAHLGLLRLGGTLIMVGAPAEPQSLNMWSLLRNRRNIAGSLIGGIEDTQQMLDFCGEHKLGADIEVISADEINAAFDRVMTGDVRYRFVVDVATLDGEATASRSGEERQLPAAAG